MKKSLLLTAGIVAASLGIIGSAQAATLESGGDFATSCTFGAITSGVLKPTNDNKTITTDSTVSGASNATFALTYFGGPSVEITTPALTTKPTDQADPTSTAVSATSTNGVTFAAVAGGIKGTITTGGSDTVSVKMSANFTDAVKIGQYKLSSTATCQ